MMNVIFAVLVLGVIAVVFGLVLSVAAKAFEVEVDERLPKIQECLAGANCGGQRLRARRRGGRCEDRRHHGYGSPQRRKDGRSRDLQRRRRRCEEL